MTGRSDGHNHDGDKTPLPYPKKRFGQHFLSDKNFIRKMVAAAGIVRGDRCLEIGPGRGALTEILLEAGAEVTAIEFDADLIAYLRDRFSPTGRFVLIEKDALKVSYIELSREAGARFKVVSNLPYNISGPLLARFIEERSAFVSLMLMLQREVALKVCGRPSTKDYGSLSVMSQTFFDCKVAFGVPRHLFKPVPKVDSSVVAMRLLDQPRVEVIDEVFFKTVVRSAFGMRRKTLLNALSGLGIPKDGLSSAMKDCSIDPVRRGETLTLAEFSMLAKSLIKLSGGPKTPGAE